MTIICNSLQVKYVKYVLRIENYNFLKGIKSGVSQV